MSFPLARYLKLATLAAAASVLPALPGAAQVGGSPRPTLSAQGGMVGDPVTVTMSSTLAAGSRVSLGFGGLSGGFELLERAEVGPGGAMSFSVAVPSWAERDLIYYFFVNVGPGTRILSDPFIVTGPEGELRVTGAVSEVADGCVVIVALDDTRYALNGVTGPVLVGSRIAVDGTLGAGGGNLPTDSPCTEPRVIPVSARRVQAG